MCVIIAKDKRDRLPTIQEMQQCFSYNSDGAGFMYTDKGKVVIDKGYMTWKTFIKHYTELVAKYDNFKDKSLVIHFRIGTGGGNNVHNTHGYPLTNKISEMQKTHTTCDVGIMHNGIISDYTPQENYYNDTQEFIKSFMYNLKALDKEFYKRKYFRDMIKNNSNSKWAILDKDDNLYTIGTFMTDNGLAFSNLNHKPYTKYNYGYSSIGKDYTTEEDAIEDYENIFNLPW